MARRDTRDTVAYTESDGPKAPFGRDASGKAKAPYGYTKRGYPRRTSRGTGGASEDPEICARQTAGLRAPWVPGQSGNPAGGRRGRTLSQAINALLRSTLTHAKRDDVVKVATELGLEVGADVASATLHDQIAVTMLEKGLDGNLQWLEAALSRTDPALSRVEMTGRGVLPIEVHRLSKEMTAEEADELYRRAIGGVAEQE